MTNIRTLAKTFGVIALLLLSLCLIAGSASAEVGDGIVIITIGEASISVDDVLAGKTVDIPVYLYYSNGAEGNEIFYSMNVAGDKPLIDGYATVKAAKTSKQPLYDSDAERNPLYLNLGNFAAGSVTVDAADDGWNLFRTKFVGAADNPSAKYPGINFFNYTVTPTAAAAELTYIPINVSYYGVNFAPWMTTGAGNVAVSEDRVTIHNGRVNIIQPPTTVTFTADPTKTITPAPTVTTEKANISVGDNFFTEFEGTAVVPASSIVPTAEGYTFRGWYNESNADSGTAVMVVNSTGILKEAAGYVDINGKWINTTAPDHKLTLYGAWTPGYSDLVFDENGGSTIADGRITYGHTVLDGRTAADIVPTRTGHTFLGWNTTDRGTWQQVFNETGHLLSSVDGYTKAAGTWNNTTSPVNLIADWKANITEFSFDETGLPYTVIAFNDTQTTPAGASLVPVKEGYTFNGWALETPTGTNLIDKDGNLISDVASYTTAGKWSNTSVNGTILNVYANWTAGYSLLTFNPLEGTCPVTEGKIYYDTDVVKDKTTETDIPSASLIAVKEHYDFGGWNVSGTDAIVIGADGKVVSGDAGIYVKGGKWNCTTDLVLNAVWTPKSTVLTFDTDGGTPAVADAYIVYNTSVTNKTAAELVDTNKAGFSLHGWNVTGTDTTIIDENGNLKTGDVTPYIKDGRWNISDATLALKAWWGPEMYTVTLDNRSAEPGATAFVKVEYLKEMPAGITLPTKTGYEFQGYYNSTDSGATFDTKFYNADGTSAHNWDIAADGTLYAGWLGKELVLNLNPDNGSSPYAGSVRYDASSASSPVTLSPVKHTLIINGWHEDDSGVKLIEPSGSLVVNSPDTDPWVSTSGKWNNASEPFNLTAHYLPNLTYAGLDGKASVVENPDGTYTIKLNDDVTGPVKIPDTWDNTTLDLNGHNIKGPNGTESDPDGKPAIILTNEGGTGTNLTIANGGEVRGGDGYNGNTPVDNPGNGGAGIKSETTAAQNKVNVNAPSKVIGGNGGKSSDPTVPGGNGGNGIEGPIEDGVNNNGGSISGGNGGDGANGTGSQNGGNGGNGGSGIASTGSKGATNNGGDISGGDGGKGGNSENGNAGNGGAGGDGSTASPTTNNNGSLSGGNGGDGGSASGDGNAGNGGAGGNGSTGNPTEMNGGELTGGDGGDGGSASGAGDAGNGGAGGDGTSGRPSTINDGKSTGGNGGNGGDSKDGNAGDGGAGGDGSSGVPTTIGDGDVAGGNGGNGGNSTGAGNAGDGGDGGAGSSDPNTQRTGDGESIGGDGGNGGNANQGDAGNGGAGGNGTENTPALPGSTGGDGGDGGSSNEGAGGDGGDGGNGETGGDGGNGGDGATGGDGGNGGSATNGDGGNGGNGGNASNGDAGNGGNGGDSDTGDAGNGGNGGNSESNGNGGNGGNGGDSNTGADGNGGNGGAAPEGYNPGAYGTGNEDGKVNNWVYYLASGSNIPTQQVAVLNDTVATVGAAPVKVPSKSGFSFAGWTTSDVTVSANQFTMPNSIVNFEASWKSATPTAAPTAKIISSGSGGGDTGSGHYSDYTRQVSKAQSSSFGSSNLVTSITYSEPVSGQVTLNYDTGDIAGTTRVFIDVESGEPVTDGQKEAPVLVSDKTGKEMTFYDVFRIDGSAKLPTDKVNKIYFKIPLSELKKQGFTENDVILYHGDDKAEVWIPLDTYLEKVDKSYAYYRAETDGASPFGVMFMKGMTITSQVSQGSTEPQSADQFVEMTPVPEMTTYPTTAATPAATETKAPASPAPVAGILAGLGLAGLLLRLRRNKEQTDE